MKGKSFWYSQLLGDRPFIEGQTYIILGTEYVISKGILRQKKLLTNTQSQVRDAFSFKWKMHETYETEAFQQFTRTWLRQKYLGDDLSKLDALLTDGTKFLDVGAGAAVSTIALFDRYLERVHYLGIDISDAIDQAKRRFGKYDLKGEFIQTDLNNLPFDGPSFDLIFAEGVLHHTDNTKKAFKALVKLLKLGGRIMFYVYAKKAPIREFCDDYIRASVSQLSDQEAWDALLPLSEFGKTLGEMNIEVDIPESIPYLQIPAGKINLQRLFYYYILKAFYHPDWSLKEINRNSFDWYRPKNCHRHTPEEVTNWCHEAELEIENLTVEQSGIATIARKL